MIHVIDLCTNGHYYSDCGCAGVWGRELKTRRIYLIPKGATKGATYPAIMRKRYPSFWAPL